MLLSASLSRHFHAAKPAEWIEPDGLGGFASGTVSGVRTRRYHALLLTARRPPTDRFVLVNGFDAWLDTPGGSFALSSQAYGRDVVSPDGATRIAAFASGPWPQWTFQLPDGTRIEQQILVPHGASAVAILWRLVDPKLEERVDIEERRTAYESGLLFLGTLGNNAPFLGLFGTVLGVITAFQQLGDNPTGAMSKVQGDSDTRFTLSSSCPSRDNSSPRPMYRCAASVRR